LVGWQPPLASRNDDSEESPASMDIPYITIGHVSDAAIGILQMYCESETEISKATTVSLNVSDVPLEFLTR